MRVTTLKFKQRNNWNVIKGLLNEGRGTGRWEAIPSPKESEGKLVNGIEKPQMYKDSGYGSIKGAKATIVYVRVQLLPRFGPRYRVMIVV